MKKSKLITISISLIVTTITGCLVEEYLFGEIKFFLVMGVTLTILFFLSKVIEKRFYHLEAIVIPLLFVAGGTNDFRALFNSPTTNQLATLFGGLASALIYFVVLLIISERERRKSEYIYSPSPIVRFLILFLENFVFASIMFFPMQARQWGIIAKEDWLNPKELSFWLFPIIVGALLNVTIQILTRDMDLLKGRKPLSWIYFFVGMAIYLGLLSLVYPKVGFFQF